MADWLGNQPELITVLLFFRINQLRLISEIMQAKYYYLTTYRALFNSYRALFNIYRALSNIYRALFNILPVMIRNHEKQ